MAAPKSAADIAAEMVAAMAVADPELDTSIGSVTRKIFDVVAEQVAPAYAVSFLQEWVYSIETKQGDDLDDYVAQFGLYRIAARRASGLIEFSRTTAAQANIPIPANTFVITGSSPRIAFLTLATAYILKGSKSVVVPIQAVNAGASGNLPVGSLVGLASSVSGIRSEVRQADATSGGVDAESDAALRERFRRTVFRNLAGTEDMFLGIALEDATPDDDTDQQAVHAAIIGPTRRWREQVQIGPDGTAQSTMMGHARYVFPGSSIFGEDIDSGAILTEGIHYTFDLSSPLAPKIVAVGTNLEVGKVYDLDYEYVSIASRNDPQAGVTNRADLWVAGVVPQIASETTYWQPKTFSASSLDQYFAGKFVRLDTSGPITPTVGNRFLQLAWGPIIDFPDSLVIAGVTYLRNVDFWVVHDDSAFGYSPSSMFGLEFNAAKVPATNAQIVLSGGTAYYYNRLPRDVEQRASRWKLVTTDFKAHAAKQMRIVCNFAVMYDIAYERGAVQAAIDSALATWMNGLGFRSVVQVSDILQVVHNVTGVDNVRFLAENEPAIAADINSWGAQVVRQDGTHISHLAYWSGGAGTGRARDWVFLDNQVPVLYDVRYVTKAQNSFGVA